MTLRSEFAYVFFTPRADDRSRYLMRFCPISTLAARELAQRSCAAVCGANAARKDLTMFDVLFVAIGVGFFAVACLYLFACDRL